MKFNRNKLIISAFITSLFSVCGVNAQSTSGGYFDGAARALVTNQAIVDTAQNRGNTTGGYTLFDLGINAVRNDVFKTSVMLRVRNEFGGFFGDGVSFNFRQIRLEGMLGKKLKWQIGDLDVALSPYSIYNSQTDFVEYESDLFAIKRDVINYENFYTEDNTWRMQGIDLRTNLKFTKGIEKIKLRFIGNRIPKSLLTSVTEPDRFVYGGEIDVVHSKNLSLGFNVANISDIKNTVQDAEAVYDNQVYTAELAANRDFGKINAYVEAEAGFSQLKSFVKAVDSSISVSDGFFDAKIGAKYSSFEANVGYRQVGHYFNSPAAQSRRIYDGATATQFKDNGDVTIGLNRTAALFDRMTQEVGLYNTQTLSTTLMSYNPIYNNATPYGQATPNRQGISVNVIAKDSAKLYDAKLGVDLLGEIIGENGKEKREFQVLTFGAKINVNQVLGIQNTLAINFGFRNEQTKRANTNDIGIDLNSTATDFGIDVEPLKRLHVLAGMKLLSAKGNEYTLARNSTFNTFDATKTGTLIPTNKVSDQVIGVGFKYIFTENATFSAQGNFVNYDLDASTASDLKYNLNQIYVLYNQKF